eukprot:5629982-Prorocentrum_lima.AAC.1
MITKLEKKHPHLGHWVNAIKHSREARTPSFKVARDLEDVITEELRMLNTKAAGQLTWKMEENALRE